MINYQPIPVSAAADIAGRYEKDVVVIVAWDRTFEKIHTTTFGITAEDKLAAAELGPILAAAAGAEMTQVHPYEDFRLDAARLKEENDQLRARLAELEAAR